MTQLVAKKDHKLLVPHGFENKSCSEVESKLHTVRILYGHLVRGRHFRIFSQCDFVRQLINGKLVEVGAHHSSLSAKPVTDIWASSEIPLRLPVAVHSIFKLSSIEDGHLQVLVRYLVAKELILISPGNLTFRRINQRRVQKKTLLNAK